MGDRLNGTQNYPFEAWNELFQNMLGSNQLAHFGASSGPAVAEKSKDSWLSVVDSLWQANPYSKLLTMEPVQFSMAFQQIWMDAITNSFQALNNYSQLGQQYSRLVTSEALKAWGLQDVTPVVEPEKGDKRFSSPQWRDNVVFDTIKQWYLLAATTMLKTASEMRGLDEKQQRRLVFYLRQFLDAISPSNFSFTNPEVIDETIHSNGQNLLAGLNHLIRDFNNGQIKITDTEAFAPGRNLALSPGQVVYRNKLIELIQYTPSTEKVHKIPLLFVPHWINKFYILDMQPHNSLVKFLVDHGFSVFVISWKNPDPSMDGITFEDYLTLGPLEALEVVKNISGSSLVNTVGYCIGGTLLSMTLPYLKAKGDKSVNSATFFVSLQDFSEIGDTSVFIDESQMALVDGQMKLQGYLDSRQMATMFNLLRDNDLIWSNVVNNYLLGKEPPAFDLLFWNSDGTRMTPAAHSFYMRNTYLENNLIKPGKIVLKGVPIDLREITQDIYAVGAEQDHIVPWKSAWRVTQLTGGKSRFIVGGSGHIAGIINPPTKGRGYWTNDKPAATAEEWFAGAEAHKGSWWSDWAEWLKARSGELVKPPAVGNKKYPPLAPAPGTYVLEK
jgi:polyhydroxyalkanoate synthase